MKRIFLITDIPSGLLVNLKKYSLCIIFFSLIYTQIPALGTK